MLLAEVYLKSKVLNSCKYCYLFLSTRLMKHRDYLLNILFMSPRIKMIVKIKLILEQHLENEFHQLMHNQGL